jgi:DNA-binding CsgD family transcriptional regulator
VGKRFFRVSGTAGASVTTAFGLQALVLPEAGGAGTYATASAAIVLAAAASGLAAGLLAVALACAVVAYAHLPPLSQLHIDRVDELLSLAMFAGAGFVVAAVGALARRSLPLPVRSGQVEPPVAGKSVDSLPSTVPVAKPRVPPLPGRGKALVQSLTTREVEVLKWLAAGKSNEDIAASLYLSVNTVKTHLKNVYGKLGVKNRTQAAARAQELGIIDAPGRNDDAPDERRAA